MTTRIGVSPLSGHIFQGRTNKDGSAFVGEKKDVTSDVLRAVIEKAKFHGGTFVIEGGGKKYTVTVTEGDATPAAQPVAQAPADFNAGIERAARWVEQRREDFDSEHGHADPETGAFEYGTGPKAQAKEDYSSELYDIVEGIRALAQTRAEPAGDPHGR